MNQKNRASAGKKQIIIELIVLAAFITLAFLFSGITGFVADSLTISAAANQSTLPCFYIESPAIVDYNEFLYVITYTENCGNQLFNGTVNITLTNNGQIFSSVTGNMTDIVYPNITSVPMAWRATHNSDFYNITTVLNYTIGNLTNTITNRRMLYIKTEETNIEKPMNKTKANIFIT